MSCLEELMGKNMALGTMEEEWRKGPWAAEEDRLLVEYVRLHGEGRWSSVSRVVGLKRNGKSCRLRWVNYLRPDLKRGQITPHEETIILELHARWGNRWSTIARSLPGRTDNEIKNYWRTHFKKKEKPTSSDTSEKSKTRTFKRKLFQFQQQQQQNQAVNMNIKLPILPQYFRPDFTATVSAAVCHPSSNSDEQGSLCSSMFNIGYASADMSGASFEDLVLCSDGFWDMDDVCANAAATKACIHTLSGPPLYY